MIRNDVSRACLVVVPVFGQQHLTHALLPDIFKESDLVDLLVIDNGGDYQQLADEKVLTPGTNIGWAAASNLGFRHAFRNGYQWAATLNNDTRLAEHFFRGLLDPRIPGDAGFVAPLYDDARANPAQLSSYRGAAADYTPSPHVRRVAAVDGTCLAVSAAAWEAVGGLDDRTFGKFSWGADIDLCYRGRAAGFGIYVSELSYLNHLGRKTATSMTSNLQYFARSFWDMRQGMRKLHGSKWTQPLKTFPAKRLPLDESPHDLTAARVLANGGGTDQSL
jgi:GT2 family glycosyltransferase